VAAGKEKNHGPPDPKIVRRVIGGGKWLVKSLTSTNLCVTVKDLALMLGS
jgi:hypothetical protein